jgi:peptide chain release factor 2
LDRQTSKTLWCIFDFAKLERELKNYQLKSEDPDLWNDREHAQSVMKKLAELRDEVEGWLKLKNRIHDTLELAESGDESFREELTTEVGSIDAELKKRELRTLLSGKFDRGNALLAIHAGAGGTDSQDWAGMLERMYLRWAESKGFETEVLDVTEGEEAGIKSITIAINGLYAYGYLLAEKGVHRLVRLSPFDSAHRRHTSFAMVEILPEALDEEDHIQINPDELRIDVFRSSGAGGQNVQKNATAIRIFHIPTGIIVTCQNERSQMQNRENAMRVLRSRLLEIRRQEQEKELAELRGEYTKNEWGSQIRSYVLHPYQMVKDHRTEFEVGNAQSVLDGNLDGLIEAYLRKPKDLN